MEVSHREDLVTHAVISSNEAQGFGMSDSAEFFNILSSTLYKNPNLAVIRETLCNAWDAHIDAGRTHMPIEVTLTKDRLVIRDFGKGIPDDKMRDRYCVYGSSTKTHDGKQTGGFGLGCKAPFAYADHFEVISNHDGVKTIYNMSKSNAQAGGKPGMIKLATLPTEDTGLQVSIDIKNYNDFITFKTLIAQTAYRGDILVKCNGDLQPMLGFDLAKSNVMLVPSDTFPTSDLIYVRYGNVIYPVEYCKELELEAKEVKDFLKSIVSKDMYAPNLILQAPPHSISVQPSREGLSMKGHTTNTLSGLMRDFLNEVKKGFLPACIRIRQAEIQKMVKDKATVKLLDARKGQFERNGYYNETRNVPANLLCVQTMEDIAKRAMAVRPPEIPGYREKDLAMRIQAMSQANLLDRGLASTFMRELASQVKDPTYRSDWLTRRVLAPLVTAVQGTGLLPHRLYVKSHYANTGSINDTLTTASYYKETGLAGVAPFLRNILVVTHKLSNLELRMNKHPDMGDQGAAAKLLVYHCGAGKADKEKSLAFFRAQAGLKVIDLTVNQQWEEANKPASVPKKPKKEGLPALSCIAKTDQLGGRELYLPRLLREDAEHITNPEFVCLVSLGRNEPRDHISGWTNSTTQILVDLYGTRGVIVNHRGKFDTAIKNGAKSFNTFVLEQLHHELTTNPRLKKYFQCLPERFLGGSNHKDERDPLRLAYDIPSLQKAFNLPKPLTSRDHQVLSLWVQMAKMPSGFLSDTQVKLREDIRAFIDAQPKHEKVRTMIKNMEDNPMLEVLSLPSLKFKLETAQPGSPQAKQMNTIMQLLFNP
ncbi:MAG TPA: ATP-binding protein [Candidatus Acidoferrum sp.]|nr:ATP-binding protein [Candidatus Acidoferrum sp.]